MKYSLDNYVGAFTQAFEKTSREDVVASFVKLLKKTGDIKFAGKIIEGIFKKLVKNDEGRWVRIETARELKEAASKSLKDRFTKKDHLTFDVNPELVAGVRITVDGEEELDNSLQNKLNKLFK